MNPGVDGFGAVGFDGQGFDAVGFDLGGVLVGLDPTWSTQIGVEPTVMAEWLHNSAPFHAFERGHLAPAAFHAVLAEQFGCTPEAGADAFNAWVTGPLPGAAETLAALEVPAFACSNTNPEHWRCFDPTRSLRRYLFPLPSHHLGARKPEPAYFARAHAIMQLPRVLFLDDRADNCEAAAASGWTAVQVEGVEQVRTILARAGLLTAG